MIKRSVPFGAKSRRVLWSTIQVGMALTLVVGLFPTPQASAAIVTRTGSTTTTYGASSGSIAKPSGTVTGDVMVVIVTVRLDSATYTCPQGVTDFRIVVDSFGTDQENYNFQGSMTQYAAILPHKATASEPASYAVNMAGTCNDGIDTQVAISAKTVVGLTSYGGVGSYNVENRQAQTGTTITAPTVTTVSAGSRVVTIYALAYGSTIAQSTPFRLRQRLAIDTNNLFINDQAFRLQYAEKAGVCGLYYDIGTTPLSAAQYYAASGADKANGQAVTWASPSSASGSTDASAASASTEIPTGALTNDLYVSGYGFSIPSDATISGVTANVRSGNPDTGAGTATQYVSLTKDGSTKTTGKSQLTTAWMATTAAGSSTDLWGTTWTPAEINSSNFGALLSANLTYLGGVAAGTNNFARAGNISLNYKQAF